MYLIRREWPIGDFIFTQDQPIVQQLAFGIRSLDLRVGFTNGAFWIFHNKFKAQVTVESVLKQVRRFVETTGEIVLLDFHKFTLGFDPYIDPVDKRHRSLVQLIVKTLGGVVAPRLMLNNTVGEILGVCGSVSARNNQTVFVMYNYDYKGPHFEFLSPGVLQNWADAQDLDHLVEYMEKHACKKVSGTLSSAQAELTAKFPIQVDGLRELAQIVNFNITNLFRERYWKCTNIVASDYFLGSGIIELAVEANKVKGTMKEGLRKCAGDVTA
ncbi:hypothetical protein V5799_021147 [Amblyomma americanum]|uniref:Uncharacterized protein n=1 Tax=Amblyomma americanum TaxID=6943 RepID=A0AAQ4FRQ5_AMBAM